MGNIDFTNLIISAHEDGASDIHLKAGCPPKIRKSGEIVTLNDTPLTSEDIIGFIKENTQVDVENLVNDNHAADFSMSVDGLRLRGNAYRDNNGINVSLRILTLINASFTELGIPEILKKISTRRSGLILITGPTGSGKTTTLTYLLQYINQTQKKHIIMIEDPIEFIHENSNSIFSQREIGRDTVSFGDAITEAMREDPDIIVVGEMRDRTSIEAALRAAETGHLVLSTLHTKGATNSITRVVDVFPTEQQNQIRTQLSMSLLAVVSQQLCPGTEKGKRHLATEVMVTNIPIRALIKQDKLSLIVSTIQTSRNEGMYTMRQSLSSLLEKGKITKETYEDYQI
ncbi:MAG: PilT/PilU family type 4a pilus ATPase [Clostridia bacterium]|nr:PilT/PilU family type 4a pilus ATPase [Clostridia bacterium]